MCLRRQEESLLAPLNSDRELSGETEPVMSLSECLSEGLAGNHLHCRWLSNGLPLDSIGFHWIFHRQNVHCRMRTAVVSRRTADVRFIRHTLWAAHSTQSLAVWRHLAEFFFPVSCSRCSVPFSLHCSAPPAAAALFQHTLALFQLSELSEKKEVSNFFVWCNE